MRVPLGVAGRVLVQPDDRGVDVAAGRQDVRDDVGLLAGEVPADPRRRHAERFREGAMDAHQFAGFFAPRLQFFLQQLHLHHHIEDDHYFPIFRKADARLVRGFEMLEGDHDALAVSIESSVNAANDFLRALNGAPADVAPAADAYMQSGAVLLRGLIRHLDDEEDLIVPLILDRGEDALGVGH